MTASTIWRGLMVDYHYEPGEPSRRGVYQEDGDPGVQPSVEVLSASVDDIDEHGDYNDEGWPPSVFVDLHHEAFLQHVMDEEGDV